MIPYASLSSYYAQWDRSGASVAERKTSDLCATSGASNIYEVCVDRCSEESGERGRVAEGMKRREKVNNRAAGHMEKVGKADMVGATSSTRSTR